MLGSFKEFTCPNTRIFISHLSYHNSVISTEETDNEFSIIIIFDMTNKSGFKTKNILIVWENFFDIFFGRFGIETENRS